MKFEEHCNESIILFGAPYAEVHKWLDEFAFKPGIGLKHRKFRHHRKGIEEAAKLFFKHDDEHNKAYEAAEQHVISDLMMEGWVYSSDHIPEDMEDYVKLGLF